MSELTGVRKVAAFLLSLDREAAAGVLRHLPDDVIPDVAQAMTELDPESAPPERVDELWAELASVAVGRQPVLPKRPDELVEVLSGSVGEEKGAAVLSTLEERRRHERPFRAVEQHPPGAIAGVLRGESPAVAALVLSHLDPALSAPVLAEYEPEAALDIVRRMTTLTPPGFTTLSAIAEDVAAQLAAGGGGGGGAAPDPSVRLQTIAEMLSFSGQEVEQAVLQGLEKDAADTAKEIRDYMFTWSDLSGVDKRSMQKILGSVNTKTLSIALKASSPEVEQNVLSNLSSRVRDMVTEERELAGPVPMTEVELAREEIMQAVRALMDSGEFKPMRAGEDLVT